MGYPSRDPNCEVCAVWDSVSHDPKVRAEHEDVILSFCTCEWLASSHNFEHPHHLRAGNCSEFKKLDLDQVIL